MATARKKGKISGVLCEVESVTRRRLQTELYWEVDYTRRRRGGDPDGFVCKRLSSTGEVRNKRALKAETKGNRIVTLTTIA
ncbi:hypothetical protein SAY87_031976 [Trapa incisa]|uniref:Uncharacterized protein n=1 Tax=Trapa incisa TaxID=236973 RepID=A0AAN7KS13_9MYRT|nr:hypothetical protein SAY87_031976 [Trapa incisa]